MTKGKSIAMALLALAALALSGCSGSGNGGWGVEYGVVYDKVHLFDGGATKGHCERIVKWSHVSDACLAQVTLESGVDLFLSEGTYLLVRGRCPICGEE